MHLNLHGMEQSTIKCMSWKFVCANSHMKYGGLEGARYTGNIHDWSYKEDTLSHHV